MDFLSFVTTYKKQLTALGIALILVTGGIAVYFFMQQATPSGTLLELSPEEIAKRLREDRAADIAMTDEERIRNDPVGYVESNLVYYYAIKQALGANTLDNAAAPLKELSEALDLWYAVVLSETQREQIEAYRGAARQLEEAIANKDMTAALSAFGGLRYLESMVLEARGSQL